MRAAALASAAAKPATVQQCAHYISVTRLNFALAFNLLGRTELFYVLEYNYFN